jgi:predicted  nucleic acid-binding Zn-ribbon protein
MNANKAKEKEKEEIIKLKTELSDISKKTQTEIDNYKTVVNDLTQKISSLEKELTNLK